MAIVVTGACGYIGSRIVRRIVQSDRDVIALDMAEFSPAAREVIGEDGMKRVRLVRTDISDSLQFNAIISETRPDAIIHNAFAMGMADYRPANTQGGSLLVRTGSGGEMMSELNLGYALRVNCGGMLNVLEAARLFGVRRVVYTSAFAALGMRIGELHEGRIGDEAVFAPDTMYGATKVVNEVMAKIYADKYNVDSIGFRIARTYGTNNPAPFTDFLRRVAIEEDVPLRDPDYINSYIFVDDCADAHVFACDAPTTKTRVFNLREGEYSNRDLANAIGRVLPSAKVTLVDGKGDGVPTPPIAADGIRDELGWRPGYSLDEGLRTVFNFWRERSGMPLI
jgi:UDP-glucose 4-epimerase